MTEDTAKKEPPEEVVMKCEEEPPVHERICEKHDFTRRATTPEIDPEQTPSQPCATCANPAGAVWTCSLCGISVCDSCQSQFSALVSSSSPSYSAQPFLYFPPGARQGLLSCSCGAQVTAVCVLPSSLDDAWEVKCQQCSGSGAVEFAHLPSKTWTQVVATALHNLALEAESRPRPPGKESTAGYFEARRVVSFILRNHSALFPHVRELLEAEVRNCVGTTLNTHPEAFDRAVKGHRAARWKVRPAMLTAEEAEAAAAEAESEAARERAKPKPERKEREKRLRKPRNQYGTLDEEFVGEFDDEYGADEDDIGGEGEEPARERDDASYDSSEDERQIPGEDDDGEFGLDDSSSSGSSDPTSGDESIDDAPEDDAGEKRKKKKRKKKEKGKGKDDKKGEKKHYAQHRTVAGGPIVGERFQGKIDSITEKHVERNVISYLCHSGDRVLWLDAVQVAPGKALTSFEEDLCCQLGAEPGKSTPGDYSMRNCHQCHNRNSHFMLCTRCRHSYCANCIRRHKYHEELVVAEEYVCPMCKKICKCATCCRRRGELTASQIAGAAGASSMPTEGAATAASTPGDQKKSELSKSDRRKERRKERDRERHKTLRRSASADEHSRHRISDFDPDKVVMPGGAWVTFQPPPRQEAIVTPSWRIINEEDGSVIFDSRDQRPAQPAAEVAAQPTEQGPQPMVTVESTAQSAPRPQEGREEVQKSTDRSLGTSQPAEKATSAPIQEAVHVKPAPETRTQPLSEPVRTEPPVPEAPLIPVQVPEPKSIVPPPASITVFQVQADPVPVSDTTSTPVVAPIVPDQKPEAPIAVAQMVAAPETLAPASAAQTRENDSGEDTSDERYAMLHEQMRQKLLDDFSHAIEQSRKRKSKGGRNKARDPRDPPQIVSKRQKKEPVPDPDVNKEMPVHISDTMSPKTPTPSKPRPVKPIPLSASTPVHRVSSVPIHTPLTRAAAALSGIIVPSARQSSSKIATDSAVKGKKVVQPEDKKTPSRKGKGTPASPAKPKLPTAAAPAAASIDIITAAVAQKAPQPQPPPPPSTPTKPQQPTAAAAAAAASPAQPATSSAVAAARRPNIVLPPAAFGLAQQLQAAPEASPEATAKPQAPTQQPASTAVVTAVATAAKQAPSLPHGSGASTLPNSTTTKPRERRKTFLDDPSIPSAPLPEPQNKVPEQPSAAVPAPASTSTGLQPLSVITRSQTLGTTIHSQVQQAMAAGPAQRLSSQSAMPILAAAPTGTLTAAQQQPTTGAASQVPPMAYGTPTAPASQPPEQEPPLRLPAPSQLVLGQACSQRWPQQETPWPQPRQSYPSLQWIPSAGPSSSAPRLLPLSKAPAIPVQANQLTQQGLMAAYPAWPPSDAKPTFDGAGLWLTQPLLVTPECQLCHKVAVSCVCPAAGCQAAFCGATCYWAHYIAVHAGTQQVTPQP